MLWGHWCLCILQGEDDEDGEDDITGYLLGTYQGPSTILSGLCILIH